MGFCKLYDQCGYVSVLPAHAEQHRLGLLAMVRQNKNNPKVKQNKQKMFKY